MIVEEHHKCEMAATCSVPEEAPQEAVDLMNACMSELPEDRPSTREVVAKLRSFITG